MGLKQAIHDAIVHVFSRLNGRLNEGPQDSLGSRLQQRTLSKPTPTMGGGLIYVKNKRSGNIYKVDKETAKDGIARGYYVKPSKQEAAAAAQKDKQQVATQPASPAGAKPAQAKRPTSPQAQRPVNPQAQLRPTPPPTAQQQKPVDKRSKTSKALKSQMDGIKKKVGKNLTPGKLRPSNPAFKPDSIIKKNKNTLAYNPLKEITGTDEYTNAVRGQLEQGRTLLSYTDEKGNMVKTDTAAGQFFYLTHNLKGLLASLENPEEFENEGTYAGTVHFAERFGEIIGSLSEDSDPKTRRAAAKSLMSAYSSMLNLSNKDQFSNSALTNFGEFVEHNFELLRGEENYMPGVGNWEVGDKVKVTRKGASIVRCAQASFKTKNAIGVDGKLKMSGAAPALSGEIHAVTFTTDKKKDKELKSALTTLFKDKNMNAEDYEKAVKNLLMQHFDGPQVDEFMANRKKYLQADTNKYQTKLRTIDKYMKDFKSPEARKNLMFFRNKLERHIIDFCLVEPLMNSRKSANFSTAAMAFDRNRGVLWRGERNDVDGYRPHAKFSAVKLDDLKITEECASNMDCLRHAFDIQGVGAEPEYNLQCEPYTPDLQRTK